MTLVPAKDYSSIESMLEIDLIALRTGATRRKQIVEVDISALASYGRCVHAGELVYPSRLMALNRDGPVPAADDAAAFDAIGLAGQAQGALIQADAEAVCKAVGMSIGNVVRAQYVLTRRPDFSGIATASSDRYGKQPHAIATVQVPGPLPSAGGHRRRRLLDICGIILPDHRSGTHNNERLHGNKFTIQPFDLRATLHARRAGAARPRRAGPHREPGPPPMTI